MALHFVVLLFVCVTQLPSHYLCTESVNWSLLFSLKLQKWQVSLSSSELEVVSSLSSGWEVSVLSSVTPISLVLLFFEFFVVNYCEHAMLALLAPIVFEIISWLP